MQLKQKLHHKKSTKLGAIFLAVALLFGLFPSPALANRDIVFPVVGEVSYTNDYLAPRSNGLHYATDIMADKHSPIVSATDGTFVEVGYPQPSWGWYIVIEDSEGWLYSYVHINNDNPGTDDGKGGAMNAYAPDVKVGNKVKRGQLIGWVGDSGNAETTPPHLHFEMQKPDGTIVNPYLSLNRALRIPRPVAGIKQSGEVLPFGYIETGARIDMGNFDADSTTEYIVGPTLGLAPYIKLFNGNTETLKFLAYSKGYLGGVDVAAGDLDGDEVDEIIVAGGKGTLPWVRIFDEAGNRIDGFFAYEDSYRGGINVAAGDIDGDGRDEIVTGTNGGATPQVKAFELNGTKIADFLAFSTTHTGGVDVATADIAGSANEEIITGAGPGGMPYVKAFNRFGTRLVSILPYASSFRGGVRVSGGNVKSGTVKSEIVTVPWREGSPQVKIYSGTGTGLGSQYFIEEWWSGFHDISASTDKTKATTGYNRRASVRVGPN